LGVQYHIGPSPDNLKVNVVNEQEYVTTPIWNVIGIINGTLSDEVVIVGNHRDAWVAGGAGDPHSGSAALNEVVRSFGKALEAGWKPLRTVVFASWDGEEYALLGSTEWVEEYLPWLSKSAVAYVNVDIGVSGPHFLARASPLLSDVLYDAASLVPSPNQTVKGQTVRDAWDGHIRILGSGSDYTAFQDFAGVPSLDVAFAKGTQHAVYQYHSNYDSFDWMDRFGDPGWHYHVTLARLLALVVAKLVEAPVIRFRASDYSAALMSYAEVIKNITAKTVASIDNRDKGEASHPLLSFRALEQALHALHEQAVRLDSRAAALEFRYHNLPWWDLWRRARMWHAIVQVNRKYLRMERQFLYQPGLDRRPWFKHVVFAPGLWTGYAGVAFPSLAESIESKEWVNAQVRVGWPIFQFFLLNAMSPLRQVKGLRIFTLMTALAHHH
jgi:N-acetylated-alpha-linked acidic dipeptidase